MFSTRLPRLRTFDEALTYWRVMPRRDGKAKVNDSCHLNVVRDDTGEVKSVKVFLHHTDIITYFRTGEVRLYSGGHQTAMTKHYLDRMSPFNVWSEDPKRPWAVAWAPTSSKLEGKYMGTAFSDSMTSDPDGRGWTEHRALKWRNRKKNARLRRENEARAKRLMFEYRVMKARQMMREPEEVQI